MKKNRCWEIMLDLTLTKPPRLRAMVDARYNGRDYGARVIMPGMTSDDLFVLARIVQEWESLAWPPSQKMRRFAWPKAEAIKEWR